jgi:hypothetical protein
LTGDTDWVAPQLRASFILDDPNLHWPTYGYVRYADLARHAEEHQYHVGMAMIPLDGWFAESRAVRIFREHEQQLSLLSHGFNHDGPELLRPSPGRLLAARAVQAMTRLARFERRTGVPVSRVVVPPHGHCSEGAAAVLRAAGWKGVCAEKSVPWPRATSRPWPRHWEAATFVAGGLPVFPRAPFAVDADELVLRAFLNQPLMLYGHHDDLSGGLQLLGDIAAKVNGIGPIKWMSVERISRTNYSRRQHGEVLHVRLLAGSISVMVPDDVNWIVVHVPPTHGSPNTVRLRADLAETTLRLGEAEAVAEPLPARPGSTVDITILPDEVGGGADDAAAGRPLWPVMRRGLTELRDRARPLVSPVVGKRGRRHGDYETT